MKTLLLCGALALALSGCSAREPASGGADAPVSVGSERTPSPLGAEPRTAAGTPGGMAAATPADTRPQSDVQAVEAAPGVSETPQTRMNLEGAMAPEFQNGASREEREKLRAYSEAQAVVKPRAVEVVGGTGDPVFDGGTMQVP